MHMAFVKIATIRDPVRDRTSARAQNSETTPEFPAVVAQHLLTGNRQTSLKIWSFMTTHLHQFA